MTLIDRRHSVRFVLPHSIVVGQSTTIKAPVYLSGALVAPTGGTVTIYDAANTEVISAAAVTITGSVAEYTVTGATTAALTVAAGWRVVWALTISGAPLVAENDAALVRRLLYSPVSDVDLIRVCPSLDSAGAAPITTATTYQDQIDEAWVRIELALVESGRRPEWIRSPSALRLAALNGALALIFRDLSSRQGGAYDADAERYERAADDAFGSATTLLDVDGDGRPDDTTRHGLESAVVWL